MVIIWGSGLYGKVDEVPRLFHVATRFGHLYYVPLIPLGSYVVLSQSGDNFQGISLPLSGKSVIFAWLRTLLVVGAIGFSIATILEFAEGRASDALVYLSAGTGALIGWIYSIKARGINRASYERAVQLAKLLDITDEARLMIEVSYGQLTAEEAAARLSQAHTPAAGPNVSV